VTLAHADKHSFKHRVTMRHGKFEEECDDVPRHGTDMAHPTVGVTQSQPLAIPLVASSRKEVSGPLT